MEKRRQRYLAGFLALLTLVGVGCRSGAQTRDSAQANQLPEISVAESSQTPPTVNPTPSPDLPTPTGFVNDFAGVLSAKSKQELEDKLGTFQREQRTDFAIVTVDSIGDMSIEDYSLEMAKRWKIGSENGGLLLVASIQDRKWRIQIDRKLEKVITNDEVLKIGRLMVPEFRRNDYETGLTKCVDAMIAALTKKPNDKSATP